MSKKILFSVLGLLVIIALGLGYKYRQDNDDIISQVPRTEGVKIISQMVDTGSLTTGSIDTGAVLSGEDKKDTIDTSNLPLCENKLNPITVIDMDKVVKNCTEKKKEGRTLDGMGGVPPAYIFSNGYVGIVLYDNNKKIDLLCKGESEGYEYFVRKLNNNTYNDKDIDDNEYVSFPLFHLEPMLKVAKKGILSKMADGMITDNMYCAEGEYSEYLGGKGLDEDCMHMKESMATSDAGYYFVAGYRDDMEGKLLYVINDKIYNPGTSTIGDYGGLDDIKHIGQSKWQFITVENNKIIVKRMKDEKINMNKKDSYGMNTTTYTLQTCEIQL